MPLAMRLFLLGAIILFSILLIYQNIQHPHTRHNTALDHLKHPLDTRLRYRIAEVDPRFGLSHADLLQLSQEATHIWKQGTGQDYFVYDPNAKLAIHLIYDQRQDESNQRQQQLTAIEQRQQHWNNQNQNIQALKQEIEDKNQQLDAKKMLFEQQLEQYNRQVQQINQSGGLHPSQQEIFAAKKQEIQQHMWSLEHEIAQFNQQINQLNQQVDALNQLNQDIDVSIQQFNARFQPRLFDKGSFDGQAIRIYEFQSKDDLRLTLAHEFGHALGLAHHNDPYALMYPMLKDQQLQNFQLRPADLDLLHARH